MRNKSLDQVHYMDSEGNSWVKLSEYERLIFCYKNHLQGIATLEAENAKQQQTINFFASVIKSGEGWSDECEAALKGADDE